MELYHTQLRTAFERIKAYNGTTIADKESLLLSVYVVNATTLPEVFWKMLLVYFIIHRPALSSPSPTHLMRIETIGRETE